LSLEGGSDVDVVTSGVKLFHMWVAATLKARSPVLTWWVGGMLSTGVVNKICHRYFTYVGNLACNLLLFICHR